MIYALFPILAAMCYGLAFAFTEKALKITSAVTYLTISAAVGFFFILGLVAVKGERFSWGFLHNPKDMTIFLIAAIAPSLGWLFTTYAIKNTNASYAAFAEISYPLFTLLFLFIFFGLRSLDWTILLGGSLIMIGSFIMVYGQAKG